MLATGIAIGDASMVQKPSP